LLGGALLFAAVVLLNWVLYRHACAMTHFVRHPMPEPASPTLRDRLRVLLFGMVMRRRENRATPADHGLAYETHELIGGSGRLSAWYIPHSLRRGMVLLFHGYQGCKAHVLSEAKAFHEMGYACFLIDFPGSGGSDGDATTLGLHEALDVVRTVDYIRDHWPYERLILFGASMGSAAILRAVGRLRVEPNAVILECPFDRLLNAVAARCRMVGVPAFPTARLVVFWGSLRMGLNGFRHNPADYARDVHCPVLLMNGSDDAQTPSVQVEAIYTNLVGDKTVHYFEGLEHESYVEQRPEEWKRQVRRFLLGQAEVVVLKAS
jgi:alpha-beta hydrolase superfamily lysophospholipase